MYDVKFVAFGAEEAGLVGSQEFAADLEAKGLLDKVVAMINLDMVGVGDILEINRAYCFGALPTGQDTHASIQEWSKG
ncbi:MAG: M28 family peptidase [Clostridia bacterium]|nr:M28 family peptidase [Clostridia bacterium]